LLVKEISMPIISVQMLSGRTAAQKSAFIKQVADIAVHTLEVPERAVTIVLTEVSAENWGVGGRTMAEQRATPPDPSSL
jgi:4-oxalocrotonate tautomerase